MTEKHSCLGWLLGHLPALGYRPYATSLPLLELLDAQSLETHVHIQEAEIFTAQRAFRQAPELA